LSSIAADTNGHALATNAPDEDLREFFIEQLIAALRGFSPQMIGYRHGRVGAEGQASEAFSVNATPKKLAFKLSWDRGRTLNLKVERNGKDVTALGRIVSGPFYRIWFADPNKGAGVTPQGAWRMLVEGKPGSAYQAAAIVDEHDFGMDVTLTGKSRRAGEPQELTVQLLRGGQPFAAEFDVDVTLQVPKISVGTAIARFGIDPARLPKPPDPKESLGGRKLNALLSDPQFARLLRSGVLRSRLKHDGKGLYRGTFSGTEVPGTYRAVIEISGPDDAGGRLHRRTNAAVHIRFAGGDAALSNLKILSSRISGGRRIVELSLMPHDRFGNILGPDHGGEIAFGAGGSGRVDVANIIDFGDGRYLATLSLPSGGKPRLTISIAGADLFSGWLDSIR
jgi:hypothetical protein